MANEVRAAGLSAVQKYGAEVHYKDILAGEDFVDLLIDDVLLVELTTLSKHWTTRIECNAPII